MKSTTILCVDDEPNVLKSLKRLLRRDPYEVITANSGQEALDLLKIHSPEVIISDQRMPGMTGTELLQQVKQLLPDSIRVVLSGYADANSILESINLGNIFRFLTKPWNDEQLREAIRQCVQQYEIGIQNRRLTEQIAAQNAQLKSLNERLGEVVEERTCSLQFAQDVLSKLPFPVLGVDTLGYVVLMNDAVSRQDSPLHFVTPGDQIRDMLPKALADATVACLSGDSERHVPASHHQYGCPVTVRRLIAEGKTRGCLIALGG